ncbi:MAG: ABC transporter permease [Actinobacteria bacterium]|nr:ABC transporter permease [Actinomycetota bacterium]
MGNVWKNRQVLRMLVLRDLQGKYRNFRLGYLWSILEPLGMTFVLWFVFSILLGGRKLGEQPYFLFLSVAILPWWWFTKGIAASTRVFRGNMSPITISLLPTEISVVRVLLVSMADFALSLPIILIAMIVTWTFPGPLILLFPVAIVIQVILMYGIGLFVASVSALVPDFARIVRIVLRAMFYLTPVLYSIANIPEGARGIAVFNPLVSILGLYRIGFWPTETEGAAAFAVGLTVTAVLTIAGIITFRRLEPRILKEA